MRLSSPTRTWTAGGAAGWGTASAGWPGWAQELPEPLLQQRPPGPAGLPGVRQEKLLQPRSCCGR